MSWYRRPACQRSLFFLPLLVIFLAASALAQSPNSDPIADSWSKAPKYFIVIAVDKSTVPNTQLPFALADANTVVQLLQNAGYKPLGNQPITGTQADINTVLASLAQIRTLPDEANVVIYYSGHGAVDSAGQDLFLQLYGQTSFGEPYGLRFSSLLQAARGSEEYGGKLAIVIDACFSGGAASSKSISLGGLGTSTVVLSSSTKKEESQEITADDSSQKSAFTYALIRAVTTDRASVDSGDGFITYEELALYAAVMLNKWHADGRITATMNPGNLSNAPLFFDYDPSHISKPNSLYRQYILGELLGASLAVPDSQLAIGGTGSAVAIQLPSSAQSATVIASAVSDDAPYAVRMLKAVAEGNVAEANALQSGLTTETPPDGFELTKARALLLSGQASKALDIYQQLATARPTKALTRELAIASVLTGQYQQAENLFKQSLATPSASPVSVAAEQNNLGVLYSLQRKLSQAANAFQKAKNLYASVKGEELQVATTAGNLADVYRVRGKYPQAAAEYEASISVKKEQGKHDTTLANEMERYSTVLANQKMADAAKQMKSEAETMRSGQAAATTATPNNN